MPDRKSLDFHLETAGGIPYRLQPGYPTLDCDFESNKVTAQEVYIIPANRIGDFYFESMPGFKIENQKLFISAGRPLPGTNFITTKKISFAPWQGDIFPGDPFQVDDNLTPAAWRDTYAQYYVATISYETTQVSEDEDNQDGSTPESFLEHSVNVGGQLIAYNPSNTKVVKNASLSEHPEFMDPLNLPPEGNEDGQQQPNKDVPILPHTKLLPTIEHNLKWRYVLNPSWGQIRACLGTLNKDEWKIFFNAARGTVMFTGLSGSQQYQWTGRLVKPGLTTPGAVRIKPWNLDFRFSEKSIREDGKTYGWNHVYSPSKGWVLLTRKGENGANRLTYDESDHTLMFNSVSPIDF